MLLFLTIIEDKEERTKIEQIYELYSKKMHQVAFGVLRDEKDAEDAVQTAMFNTWKHLKKLQDPKDENTKWYVMQAAQNAAINIYWKNKRRRERETVLDENLIGNDVFSRYDQGSELSKQIAKLSPRDREVLMLKFIYGYEYAEIAQILNISTDAAKKAGSRAKERLERYVRGEEKNDD